MKRNLLIILLLAILSTSCESWLDINPKAQIKETKLFKTQQGFEDALYGIYGGMNKETLYGKNLMYGFVDVVAQYYKIGVGHRFEFSSKFEYDNIECINIIDNLFLDAYKVIANCNLLLENLERVGEDFFSDNRYKIIKAEVLAIRAYLHFDMLRLFSPNYKGNENSLAIPYANKMIKDVHKQYSLSETIVKIKNDLAISYDLLKDIDPIFNEKYKEQWYYKFWQPTHSNDDFVNYRAYRLNYFAVCALMARVNLYANLKTEAYKYASEVIKATQENYFTFTKESNISAEGKDKDALLSGEIIFSLNNLDVNLRYNNDSRYSFSRYELYDITSIFPSENDWRKSYLIGKSSSNKITSFKFLVGEEEFGQKVPLLRVAESYLIAAESIFEENKTEAIKLLKELRLNRGIAQEIEETINIDEFKEIIIKEYRKEFVSEGQMFYLYKRLNIPIRKGSGEVESSQEKLVLPMPSIEIQYGKRK